MDFSYWSPPRVGEGVPVSLFPETDGFTPLFPQIKILISCSPDYPSILDLCSPEINALVPQKPDWQEKKSPLSMDYAILIKSISNFMGYLV